MEEDSDNDEEDKGEKVGVCEYNGQGKYTVHDIPTFIWCDNKTYILDAWGYSLFMTGGAKTWFESADLLINGMEIESGGDNPGPDKKWYSLNSKNSKQK